MEYKNIFEIEFIQRTQEIVNGYQIPFENTLFINACVGLLIIPQQSLFNHLPTEVVSADKWGIADTDISCIKEPNKSVKNVARHIRNAIAHDGIRFGSDNGKDITHIKITDWKDERHKTETFKAVIEVTKFKTFVWAFAQFALTQQSLFKSQNRLHYIFKIGSVGLSCQPPPPRSGSRFYPTGERISRGKFKK